MSPKTTMSLEDRFWSKVDTSGDCWVWTDNRFRRGYGKISIGNKQRRAHRVAWELTNGPIPDGLLVCHSCDNPPCVRPDHLFLGTTEHNVQDRVEKGRTAMAEKHGRHTHPERYRAGSSRPGREAENNSNARLTWEQVREIRTLAAQGWPNTHIARQFAVTPARIGQIVRGQGWKEDD